MSAYRNISEKNPYKVFKLLKNTQLDISQIGSNDFKWIKQTKYNRPANKNSDINSDAYIGEKYFFATESYSAGSRE